MSLPPAGGFLYFLSRGRRGGQASNEDLFPLGYGERERVRVRVKKLKGENHDS
jgi:hypothetical protein